MNKNKKDFVFRAIAIQSAFCLILFGFLYFLKQSNSNLFFEIKKSFSKKLSENIAVEDVESVFNSLSDGSARLVDDKSVDDLQKSNNTSIEGVSDLLESETEFVPFDEPSLSVTVEATGGLDYSIENEADVPDNASLSTYTITENMINPVINGRITSEFGSRIHPISNQLTFHAGIDIAADKGTPIYSAFDGKVLVSDYDEWNGNFLKIQHEDDLMTVYCHCDSLNVKKGDVIRAGEVIGYVGSTGSSTGPHLHFELRIDNVSYNPQIALSEAQNVI